MATPPTREREDASAGRSEGSLNWGWIALGGCLGLAVILLLNPVSLMVIGMWIGAKQQEREFDRWQAQATASAAAALPPTLPPPELICDPVTPAVVARIEARLREPGTKLRGAQAVRSATKPQLWVVAADLEGVGRYEGDHDIGVWTIRWDDADPPGTLEVPASVAAVNGLAAQAGPFSRSAAEMRIVAAAVACANEALGRG